MARLRRSGLLERCLQRGETAPDFAFIDQDDHPASLYELCDCGPVVVNFFRGFWCGYCQSELAAYQEHVDEIRALGASYLTVSPHSEQELAATAYPSICDCDNEIARGFGILYELEPEERDLLASWGVALDHINRSGRWELPVPAVYLVAPDRTVAYRFMDVDYRNRLAPEELLAQLRLLVGAAEAPAALDGAS